MRRKVPNPQSALNASRHYAGKPHIAGSKEDFQTAKDFLSFLQETLGIEPSKTEPIFSAGSEDSQHATLNIPKLKNPSAWIDVYYPLMNTPVEHALQALDKDGNVIVEFDLEEKPDAADPDAHKYAGVISTFHGLSADGDVKGEVRAATFNRR